MKIVKYIFLLLVLAAIGITVFIATQEGTYSIKKERLIKAPQTIVYNYINDLKNWQEAGILATDSTASFSFPGETIGKGALANWVSNNGDGSVRTINTTENDSIIQNATLYDVPADVAWNFKDTLGSTKITLQVKGQLTFTEKAYALFNIGDSKKLEKNVNTTLDNINTFLVDELTTFNATVQGVEIMPETFYLGYTDSTSIGGLRDKLNTAFPKLFKFVSENKIVTKGSPFVLYKKQTADSVFFAVCTPLREEIFTAAGSEFVGDTLRKFAAVKTTLKGDYSHLPEARAKAAHYIVENNLKEDPSAPHIEVYSTAAAQTKRASQWVTQIYIPVVQIPQQDTTPGNPTAVHNNPAVTRPQASAVQAQQHTTPQPPPHTTASDEDEE